jgi:hypothetical protein
MSSCEIDNAQAPHPQADLALDKEAIVVRATMGHDVAHTP